MPFRDTDNLYRFHHGIWTVEYCLIKLLLTGLSFYGLYRFACDELDIKPHLTGITRSCEVPPSIAD